MDGGGKLVAGRFNAAPAALTDGQEAVIQVDQTTHRLILAGYDVTTGVSAVAVKPVANTTYTYTHAGDYLVVAAMTTVIKSSQGLLAGIEFENQSGLDLWFQVWNRNTLPTSGATSTTTAACPLNWLVKAGTSVRQGQSFFGLSGWYYSTGITWAVSTRKDNFTVPAAGTETLLCLHMLYK